jgi:excinuclease UvrABC nuclease subunit
MSKWKRISSTEELPESAGCYVVSDGVKTYYVGRTTNLYNRLNFGHCVGVSPKGLASKSWGQIDGGRLSIRESSRYAEELMIEAQLIRRLRPIFNVSGNPVYDEKVAQTIKVKPLHRLRITPVGLFERGPKDDSFEAIAEWLDKVEVPRFHGKRKSFSR